MQVEDVPRETVAPAQHDLDMMDSTLDNSNSIQSQLGMTMSHLLYHVKSITNSSKPQSRTQAIFAFIVLQNSSS